MRRLVGCGAALVCALALVPAGSALADTSIGQTGASDVIVCGGQQVLADTQYVVPSGGGFITSFSFQSESGNAGSQLDFLVLRPAGGSTYQVIGRTGLVTLAGTGVETFSPPALIAARAGDIIGWWNPSDIGHCLRPASGGGTTGGAVGVDQTTPDPSVGGAVSLTGGPGTEIGEFDVNESANIAPTPTSKDQCKNGGWQNYPFPNQGECVVWVNHNT
jgi:hypothetical protein